MEGNIHRAESLSSLCRRLGQAIAADRTLNDVWITAETSDVRVSGGHCYMELIEKDERTGGALARCRAVMWANTYARVGAAFAAMTGGRLRSDLRIMARVSANYHAVYGLSLVISDIDATYTVGDLMRRRLEIVAQLQADGVYDLNRSLAWSATPWRVAVVSAVGAAGYGDFMKQLLGNAGRLRFETELFCATLQGERTPRSVISALDRVMERVDDFDCVVIIRGGGAVSDLASFDDYELAYNVAQFPLPVIVGIGHERDTTVLDYVANTSVKTPTAAAQVLIGRMGAAYGAVCDVGKEILDAVRGYVEGQRRQLAYYSGTLPALVQRVFDINRTRTGDVVGRRIAEKVRGVLQMQRTRLESMEQLVSMISPEATLRRGYTITRKDGRAVSDVSALKQGDVIVTQFAAGEACSVVD